jgi:hypothetical protein
MNGFYGAFGFPVHFHIGKLMHCSKYGDDCYYIATDISQEIFFFADIIINFFIEFKSEEKLYPIRDIAQIAERYLKGTFLIEFISFFPFIVVIQSITTTYDQYDGTPHKFGYLQLLFLLRLFRIIKIYELVRPRFFA